MNKACDVLVVGGLVTVAERDRPVAFGSADRDRDGALRGSLGHIALRHERAREQRGGEQEPEGRTESRRHGAALRFARRRWQAARPYSLARRSRSELPMTATELSAIAAPATIGLNSSPNDG